MTYYGAQVLIGPYVFFQENGKKMGNAPLTNNDVTDRLANDVRQSMTSQFEYLVHYINIFKHIYISIYVYRYINMAKYAQIKK